MMALVFIGCVVFVVPWVLEWWLERSNNRLHEQNMRRLRRMRRGE